MALTCVRFVVPKFAPCLQRMTSVTVPALLKRRQRCSYINKQRFSSSVPKPKKETVTVYFLHEDGSRSAAKAPVGENLLDIILDNDIDIDGFEINFCMFENPTTKVQYNEILKPQHSQSKVGHHIALRTRGLRSRLQKSQYHLIREMKGGQKMEMYPPYRLNHMNGTLSFHLGACEGTLACSTCHLIFKKPDYDKIPEKPTDEELDMLDLAYGLSETSRLGCQVIVTKDMDGLEVQVPSGVADARDPS